MALAARTRAPVDSPTLKVVARGKPAARQTALQSLGENLRLARLRRAITARDLAAQCGLSVMTLRGIERGLPSVAIGHYLTVLDALGLADSLARVGADDPEGHRIRDAELGDRVAADRKRHR